MLAASTYGREPGTALRLAAILLLGSLQIACGEPAESATSTPAGLTDVNPWAETDLSQTPAPEADAGPTQAETDAPATGEPARILTISPDHGPTSGLTDVVLQGTGFEQVEALFFDESPAVDFETLDSNTIIARSPPRPAGFATISARLNDKEGTIVELPMAFRYEAQVGLKKVDPDHGSVLGGEVVTITGTGLSATTHFVFGQKLAIDTLIIDEFTAIVRTPPGTPGRVAVTAADVDGTAIMANAFEYIAKPEIVLVDPAVVPLPGGTKLTLYGTGLVAKGAVVRVLTPAGPLPAAVHAAADDGSWIRVIAPAADDPGLYAIRYSGPAGSSTLAQALLYAAYIDLDTGKPFTNKVAHVLPAASPVNRPTEVVLYMVGPIATQAVGEVAVTFGKRKATVLSAGVGPGKSSGVGGTIRVLAPTAAPWATPGKVDIKVTVGGHAAVAKAAFEWLPAEAAIVAVAPEQIAAAGGTAMQVELAPAPSSPVAGIRVGALMVTSLSQGQADANGHLVVTAMGPKGSPGPADVRVILADGTELLATAAVEFTSAPQLAAIVPGIGAQAGGTLVHVVGSGLDKLHHLGLDGVIAGQWEVIHSGLVQLHTPPGDPGPADLEAFFDGGLKLVLPNAFIYFDPLSGNLGTWGPAINGAVNITVLQSNMGGGPVEGALVVIGNDPATARKGTTDARGQITFSDAKLKGPLLVSAAKSGYTAASVVAVNSENITVRLRVFVTPPVSPGKGGGDEEEEDPFPNGFVDGVVVNAAKYAPLPPGTCDGQAQAGGNCAPCVDNAGCWGDLTCESLDNPMAGFVVGGGGDVGDADPPKEVTETGGQKYCAAPCINDDACPPAYECRAIGWSPGNTKYRCAPRIGKAEVRCETSSPSMFGGNPQPGPGAVANEKYEFHIEARLGDVAVACTAGYVEWKTGKYVPLVMGLQRAVSVAPDKTTAGVKVFLNIPLTRRVRVRLERIPMGPDAQNHERFIYSALNLGAEGYIPLADVMTTQVTDTLVMTRQPALQSGPHAGIGYDIYGGIHAPGGGSPTAIAAVEELQIDESDHFAWWPTAEPKPLASVDLAAPVNDMHQAAGLIVAVGDRGYIGVWSGKSFTAQASPTSRDLEAVWLTSADDGWAGGDGGMLLRRDPVEGWKIAPSPTKERIVDIAGRSGSDVWLLLENNQLQHFDGTQWQAVAGPWPVPVVNPNAWPKLSPPHLHVIWQAPDGELMLAGDGGGLVSGKLLADKSMQYKVVSTGTKSTIRALWGLAAGDFWLAGDRGLFAHVAGDQFIHLQSDVKASLLAVIGNASGIHAVGGGGAWLQMDLQGNVIDRSLADMSVDFMGIADAPGTMVAAGQPVLVMGPFVEMPYILQPKTGAKIGNVIEWQAAPGVTPTLNMIRVAAHDYTTLWEIFVKGDVTKVTLPIFTQMGGADPLPPGQLRVRIWRINAPQLSIDHFSHKQLSIWRWVSYAYNWIMTEQPLHPGSSEGMADIPMLPPP